MATEYNSNTIKAMQDERISKLVALLQSHRTTVIVGAGLSTGSGIPDFRSSNGRYKNTNLMELASKDGLYNSTDLYHDYYNQRIREVQQAKPTVAHTALAMLYNTSHVNHIVSQNVDDLLERAGCDTGFVKLHGNLLEIRCDSCETKFQVEDYTNECTLCNKCGGHLRTGIVMFGESVSDSNLEDCLAYAYASEAIVIIGTQLDLQLPRFILATAMENNAKLVVINRDSIGLEEHCYLNFQEDIGEVLGAVQSYIELTSR